MPQKKSMIKPAGLPDVGNASSPKLVVAIASRALFDLDESHQIFEEQGAEAYARYQIEQEDNGNEAQSAYSEIVHAETREDRKQQLIAGLRDYCELDTLAMVRLAWFFEGIDESEVGKYAK